MVKFLENISIVAIATVLSRVLGLLRDILLFAFLGTGSINSAFIFAFTLPNLFRRLLGEGALTSALVPILSGEMEKGRESSGFQLLNRVLSRTFLALLGLVAAGSLVLWSIFGIPDLEERWYMGAGFGILLLPYMIFVCLAAVIGAGLNVLNRFAVVALSPVWLNLSIILALVISGGWAGHSNIELVGYLCVGVLAGGLMQVVIPGLVLRKQGWKPRFSLAGSARLEELWALLLPGLAGAAIIQVNIAVSRLLALWLDETAVSVLYLANRLIELPLGVFAIAVTTVVFPSLSRHASAGREEEFAETFRKGKRLILAITIPAAIGLILLGRPILELFFAWGAYGREDVVSTYSILGVYACGLPFYALATYNTRAFHALKNTRTPMRLALLNFVLNIGFSLGLMREMGMTGLALANVLAIIVHSLLLRGLLTIPGSPPKTRFIRRPLLKIMFAATGMGGVTWVLWKGTGFLLNSPKMSGLAAVFVLVPLAVVIYLALLRLVRFEEVREARALWDALIRRLGKKD